MALADKKRDHIPYRQSKLTNVLRDSLGGNCNTLLIANIWGEQAHIEETISTLRFATRMMCVSTTPIVNIQYDPAQLIRKYEREIRELKQELNMYDTISNKSHVHYEAFNDIQKLELMKTLRNFIDNDEVEIDIVNLRQIKEIFGLFKIMIKNLESDEEKLRKRESVSHSAPSVPQTTDLGVIKDIEREDGVGDVEGSGFGIGLVFLHLSRFHLQKFHLEVQKKSVKRIQFHQNQVLLVQMKHHNLLGVLN